MTTKKQIEQEDKYLDEVIMTALMKRKKVTLFLCKDREQGFGIKIDNKIIARNLAWESFEYPMEDCK